MKLLLSLTCLLLPLSLANPSFAQTIYLADLSSQQGDSLLNSAKELIRYNQLFAAQGKLEQALQIYRSSGDKEGEFKAAIDLALVYFRQDNYFRAQQNIQQAESILIVNNPQLQGKLFSLKGQIYLETGEYQQALVELQKAQTTQIPDLIESNRIRIALGEVYNRLGWYDKSLSYLQIAKASGDRTDNARAINALGDVYYDLGEYAKALDYYEQALSVRQSIGDRNGTIRTLNNLGKVKRTIGNTSEAIDLYQEAIQQADGLGDLTAKVYILNNLGEAYGELGEKDQAIESFQAALNHARDHTNLGYIQTLNNLGKYSRQLGKYPQSTEYYQEALSWSRKVDDRPSQGKSFVGLGQVYLGQKQIKEAIDSLEKGIEILESLRPGLEDGQKVSLFETQAYAYQVLQKALVEKGDYNQALIVAERGRARAFAELLLQNLVDRDRINETSKNLTIAEIQSVAKTAKATLVEYSILYDEENRESELLFWVIKPTGEITFKKVDLRPKNTDKQQTSRNFLARGSLREASRKGRGIDALVSSFRGNLLEETISQTDQNTNALSTTRQAYDYFIKPIADLLPQNPQENTILIPQKSLFLIPFHALQDDSGQYLIEKHTLSIAPSIQILALTQKNPANLNLQNSLIVGNPIPMPEPLLPLPGAEAEAADVAKILKTQALLNEKATETAIIERISQASSVHFATHGLFNDRQGLQSAIALAASGDRDGFLTAEEIINLPLQANLAVLSACNTGRGQITGDGVIGLSRSFMSAGVPSVVVSLWSIPDMPTAILMTQFYRNLENSPHKAQALRQAMLAVMKTNPDPHDWAGFVLVGQP